MARNTKAAKPQQDLKDVRSTLQMNQNKKLTPEQFGQVLTKAFGQEAQYNLSKAITAITDRFIKDVHPKHITFDYRGGWGKAANVRAFIPQHFNGVGVWVRISLDVVDGVWDASTARTYEEPHVFNGPAIEVPTAGGNGKREDAPQASIPPSKHGMASVRSVNLVETERSGLVYVTVDVITGQLNRNDIVNVYDFEDKLVGEATVENLFRLDQHTLETVDAVETLNMGETGAVNFDATFHGNLSAGFKAYVSKPVVAKTATVEEAAGNLKQSFASIGRAMAPRSLHARPALPDSQLGVAVVVDMFKSPKGDVQGVDVIEGSVRVGDVIQVWRDGRYHVGGEIELIRQYKDIVNEVGALGENRSCGLNVKFDGVTDLKVGDRIFVVKRPELADFSDAAISYTQDARGHNAIINVEGRHRKDITDMSREAMCRLGVAVSEIPQANGAVMEMYDMTANSNLAGALTKLTITMLHNDVNYDAAVRIEMVGKVGEIEGGIGTIHILDGQARRRVFYGVGAMDYPSETIGRTFHGLVAYHILGQYLRDLDERDRADFETAYLETHRLGLAEGVSFVQGSNTVMEIWVEKSKYHASGYKAASLEFGSKGLERFHFFKMEEPTGPQSPTEITVDLSGRDRFEVSGPIDGDYTAVLREQLGEHNQQYLGFFTSALMEVKRVATEALVDNPDYWKDGEVVPWKALFRFGQGPRNSYGKASIVCLNDRSSSGFSLDLQFDGLVVSTSLVYGFGRYSNILMLQGVAMHRFLGARVIAEHLIDKTPGLALKLTSAIAPDSNTEGKIILAQKPERNAMVVILQGYTADEDDVLVELNLVNGRIVSWNEPKAKLPPVKPQPQPHRHHHMDPGHKASSIVPRPRPVGNFTCLAPYQAQSFIKQLFEEGEEASFQMLNDFVERVVANGRDGGTGDALLFSLNADVESIELVAQFLDALGQAITIAKMSVHF